MVSEPIDPVRERRARIARAVAIAQRVGFGALLVAAVVFAIGLSSDFPDWTVAVTVGALSTAIVVLPIPMVLGYGIRAAERDERRGPTPHG